MGAGGRGVTEARHDEVPQAVIIVGVQAHGGEVLLILGQTRHWYDKGVYSTRSQAR